MSAFEALPTEAKVCVAGACVLATSLLMNTLTASPKEEKLIPVIMGMATANPPYRVSQQQALAVAEQCPACESLKPVLARIYGNSRIDYRHMARRAARFEFTKRSARSSSRALERKKSKCESSDEKEQKYVRAKRIGHREIYI